MFDIGFSHLMVLGIVGVLVLGPERLPGFARDAGRALANLRELARTTRNQVQEGFGTDLVGAGARLKDPRALVREFLAEADAPAAAPRPRRPRPYPTTDPEAH